MWTVTPAAFIHQHQSALALEGHPHRYPKAYLPATPFGADFEASTKHAGPIVPLGPHLPPLKTPPFLERKPLQSAGWRSILKADVTLSPIFSSSGCSQTAGAPHQPCTPLPTIHLAASPLCKLHLSPAVLNSGSFPTQHPSAPKFCDRLPTTHLAASPLSKPHFAVCACANQLLQGQLAVVDRLAGAHETSRHSGHLRGAVLQLQGPGARDGGAISETMARAEAIRAEAAAWPVWDLKAGCG